MKKSIMSLLFLMGFGLTQAAHAGNELGNGGGAWVCRNGDGSIRWSEIVDIYEGKEEFGLNIVRNNELSRDQQLAAAEERMKQADSAFHSVYLLYRDEVANALHMLTRSRLEVVDDALYRLLPLHQSCPDGKVAYEQVANFTHYGVILVDRMIYESLPPTDQAALHLHEAIYRMLRVTQNATNSADTRRKVAYLLSDLDPNTYREQFSMGAVATGTYNPAEFAIQPIFDSARPFSEGLAAVSVKEKWGFVDHRGAFVVPPLFEEVGDFHDDLSPAKLGGKWGYIDRAGTWAIQPIYLYAMDFSSGVAPVQLPGNSNMGYIDRTGRMITGWIFDHAAPFREGLGAVRKDDNCGYVKASGQIAIPLRFRRCHGFSEGRAAIETHEQKDKYGFIDTQGRIVIAPQFRVFGNFNEGLAPVQYEGALWNSFPGEVAFIDRSGNPVIRNVNTGPGRYAYSLEFSGGLAETSLGKFMNHEGKIVLESPYVHWSRFEEGLTVILTEDRLMGMIERSGKVVLEPKYLWVSPSREGLIPVRVFKLGKWGYIANPLYKQPEPKN